MTERIHSTRLSLLLALLLILIGTCVVLPAAADDSRLEQGIAAYEAEDYERAYELLKPESEAGDPEAQYYVGQMYGFGLGVEKDLSNAVAISRDAAEHGHPGAQETLAYAYFEGVVVDQDYEKAARWYEQAAENGNKTAQRSIGFRYKNGEGVERDYEKAAEWFHKAAEQGDDVASLELAIAYHHGQGVAQDYERAAQWSRRAMEAGYARAQRLLAWQYVAGEGVDQDLDRAKTLYRDLLSEGEAQDQFALGVLLQGEAEENDDETLFREAYELFREAASQGHELAMLNVGAHYSNGWGVERDNMESTAWLLLSRAHGHAEAQMLIDHQLEYAWDADLEASQARARELVHELDLDVDDDQPFAQNE